MKSSPEIVKVAVPVPLYGTFDYLPPKHWQGRQIPTGTRVRIPFGRGSRIGLVTGNSAESDIPKSKLKSITEVLDETSLIAPDDLAFLEWAAQYYHHPVGEVFEAALPALLRQGKSSDWSTTTYHPTGATAVLSPRAKKQRAVLEFIQAHPGLDLASLQLSLTSPQQPLKTLITRGLVESRQSPKAYPTTKPWSVNPSKVVLNPDQDHAVRQVTQAHDEFGVFLLHGVTGSGKTEVYLHILEQVLSRGKQALLLVPEISLTPQLVQRFREKFSEELCVMHSGLSPSERLDAWHRARIGASPIVLGTRSAVFAPLARCSIIIVDEEHDPSLKQQEGFRYSARDLCVVRARRANVPLVLGSATPSLESLKNVEKQHYHLLTLPKRTGKGGEPKLNVVDLTRHTPEQGLSTPLIEQMSAHLKRGNQVLLFLNRRGYAPVLFCTECGWIATCHRCDANLTLHEHVNALRCHHCGYETKPPTQCSQCQSDLKPIGQGTQRIEQVLEEKFPDYPLIRIDRDSTQRVGAMEAKLKSVATGAARIVLGTQMLTKGHDFPNVTLVGVLDGDQGLFGTDFRSNERFAQTVIQVAGRAGRGDTPGEVVIQTHFPNHPLLQQLIKKGYGGFAQAALREREASGWPPFRPIALLRTSATKRDDCYRFLSDAKRVANNLRSTQLQILGPAAAPMEKRAGRFRAQILLIGSERAPLHNFLSVWIDRFTKLPTIRRVRWSIDVDPIELF